MNKLTWSGIGLLLSILLLVLLTWLLQTPAPTVIAPAHSYIIQGLDTEQVAHLVEAHGGTITSRLDIIQGVGALLSPAAVEALRHEAGVTAITPNAPVRAADMGLSQLATTQPTADYSEVVGANQVWAQGIVGDGVAVAVLDTGVKATLSGIFHSGTHLFRTIIWQDFIGSSNGQIVDPNGHGTHVTGIILSSWKGTDNKWNGIAPDVDLVSVRVLDENGVGSYESVIQGIQWVVANRATYNIKVMNLSLVAMPQSPYWADPMNQAVMQAWADGITVVAAAGNTGPTAMSTTVPGNVPYVITVGAFTDNFTPGDWSDDYITPFSAAGPTLDAFVKPDVVAPGAHMASTMQSNTYLAQQHPDYMLPANHALMAGTSQATGVVSGIAALMLSQNPSLTPDQVKYRLMNTSLLWVDPITGDPLYSVWQQGAGRVNAPDAVLTTTVEAANVDLDILADLADPEGGYEGYTYYDEEAGEFRLYNAPESWAGGYSAWAGGYSAWAGGYSAWAGSYGDWAGGFDAWSGGYSAWAGGYSAWAGGYSAWAGGYSAWAGGYSAWAGSEPWIEPYGHDTFVASFVSAESPSLETPNSTNRWVEEQDWQGLPFLAISDAVVTEGDVGTGTAVFTVTLSVTSTNVVSVAYSTADGTATASTDYQPISGTLTFQPGETLKTVAVLVFGDTEDETNENFFIHLSNEENAIVERRVGMGTILDDDGLPNPDLVISDTAVIEGDDGSVPAVFTVTLSLASTEPVTVTYRTSDHTAREGIDYVPITDTLVFAPGETIKTITVLVNGDTVDEEDEIFFVNLLKPVNASASDPQGAGTILNDDEPPSLSISDTTVTEGDIDAVTATFTVTLSTYSGKWVKVDYATADGMAAAGKDYIPISGTLTFAPGQTTRSIQVEVVGDLVVEADETFFISLSNPVNVTMTNNTATGIILNDDDIVYHLYLPVILKP